jgi:hypothetical protein
MSRNEGTLLYPPFPVTTIFLFQVSGTQTSKFTSESFEVTTCACTRQKAGVPMSGARDPGGLKEPAAIISTLSTVVFSSATALSAERSHCWLTDGFAARLCAAALSQAVVAMHSATITKVRLTPRLRSLSFVEVSP